ncbi:MAG: Gfo/Idh/MocA family oxidoreductase [Chthoniobacterales bacterium]|nr:Gfo/Idh/MocA family oxidoreductase [Chthoniobacterales bacterium]
MKNKPRHTKKVRLAIVGTGGMANFHAGEFLKDKGVELVAVCDIDAGRAREFAAKHSPSAAVFTDFGRLLREVKPDAVSNVTPDSLHAPLTLRAIAAGCHVFCEKPLATDYPAARKMARAAVKAGLVNMVNFSYRNAPAIQMARELVREGKLGDIVHVEASYLQSWLTAKAWGDWKTNPAWLWRLSSKHGSKGVLGDIGVHIIDFATFPVGPVRSANARLKTFTSLKGKKRGAYTLDANDSALVTVEFANGALGAIHATRWATGQANSLLLRLHGTKGGLRIDLDKSTDSLEVCLGPDIDKFAWKTVKAPAVPTTYQRFISAVRCGRNGQPDFIRGAEIQKILDACFVSDEAGRTVRL